MIKDILKNIFSAIEKYNKIHSPEATAKFVRNYNNSTEIEFSGSFCQNTCDIVEWFEDFANELKKKRIKAKISDIKELEKSFLVIFNLKEG